MSLNSPEPNPNPNDTRPIHEMLIDDIRSRSEAGKEKYGTYLQAHNGRRSLIDVYQELIDALLYIRQEIEERAE